MWVLVCGRVFLSWWCSMVSTGPEVGRASRASGPAGGWLWASGRVYPPFGRLTALRLVRCLQIWLYFAFLGVFRGFYVFRVGLCWLGGLRGLCGFCARVELGGYMACGVFAFMYPFLCLSLPFFLSLYLLLVLLSFVALVVFCLSSCIVFVGLWVCCCFFFPYGLYAKREGAPCWCVLSCPVVCCFIWLRLCIPRTRQVSARLYRNKVLEKGNLNGCSKLSCVLQCSCLCSSKLVFLLFSYLFFLVGSYFLSSFRCRGL